MSNLIVTTRFQVDNQEITVHGEKIPVTHANNYTPPLPVGNEATGWNNSGDGAAICTLPAGNASVPGLFDVYWATGGKMLRRFDVAGALPTPTSLSLSGGSGDALPATGTNGVVVTPHKVINVHIDPKYIVSIGIALEHPDQKVIGRVNFMDATGAVVKAMDLAQNTNSGIFQVKQSGVSPFGESVITTISATNSNSSGVATLKVLSAQNTE